MSIYYLRRNNGINLLSPDERLASSFGYLDTFIDEGIRPSHYIDVLKAPFQILFPLAMILDAKLC
jgi:hypothetical protein